VGGLYVTQNLYEETWNAASNLCWRSVKDPCRIVSKNCRRSWNRSSWHTDLKIFYFQKIFWFLLHNTADVMNGGKGAQLPGRRNTAGEKIHKNVISTFLKTVHLLQKDLKFEHVGAKCVSCPRLHLTSLRPCISRLPV